MNILGLLFILGLSVLPVTGGTTELQKEKFINSPFVGLWRYPNRGVWVTVNNNGDVFQCRIARNGTVITSQGALFKPNIIVWSAIWGQDFISQEKDTITLDGTYGRFAYRRTETEMAPACNAPF